MSLKMEDRKYLVSYHYRNRFGDAVVILEDGETLDKSLSNIRAIIQQSLPENHGEVPTIIAISKL